MISFKNFLLESEHEEYYHVTPTKNLKSIKQNGLVPSVGKSSSKAGEGGARTYLFKHKEHAEDAVSNWMGDEHDEDEKLSLLKVKVHPKHVEQHKDAEWEHSTQHKIEPKHIRVITKNF